MNWFKENWKSKKDKLTRMSYLTFGINWKSCFSDLKSSLMLFIIDSALIGFSNSWDNGGGWWTHFYIFEIKIWDQHRNETSNLLCRQNGNPWGDHLKHIKDFWLLHKPAPVHLSSSKKIYKTIFMSKLWRLNSHKLRVKIQAWNL